jgi:hypothetical protein
MATFDPNFPLPDHAPEVDPTPSVFSFPNNVPPDGAVIDVPSVEVMPQQQGSEPLDGPDEGGEPRDFPLPPEPEIDLNAVDAGGSPVVVAGGDAGDGTDSADDGVDNDGTADSGGGSSDGAGGDDGGGDEGGGDAG